MNQSSSRYPVIAGAVMAAAVAAACAATMPSMDEYPPGAVLPALYGPEPPDSIELLIRNVESGVVASASIAAAIAGVKALCETDKALELEDSMGGSFPPASVPPAVPANSAVITEGMASPQQAWDQEQTGNWS